MPWIAKRFREVDVPVRRPSSGVGHAGLPAARITRVARRARPCYVAVRMRPGVVLVLALAAIGGSLVVGGLPGCGGRATTAPSDKKDGGPPGPGDASAAVDVDAAVLGLPDLAAYGWRKRGGEPAFRLARKAEERGDWAAAATACEQALAADPGHLDASWLYAVALAHLGRLDQVLAPLQRAAAGDLAKWGQASLELPGLRGFLATPVGAAWRRRVELDLRRFAEAIARSLIVTAGGVLYGVEIDPTAGASRSAGEAVGAPTVVSLRSGRAAGTG